MDITSIINKSAVKLILIVVNSIGKLQFVKTATKVMLLLTANVAKVNKIQQTQDVVSSVTTIPVHNFPKVCIWALMGNAKRLTITAELGMIKVSAFLATVDTI